MRALGISIALAGIVTCGTLSIDPAAVKKRRPGRNRVKQHLHLVHSSTTRIELSPFAFKGDDPFPRIADILVEVDRLCVREYELRRPRHLTLVVDNGNKPHRARRPLKALFDVADDAFLEDVVAECE